MQIYIQRALTTYIGRMLEQFPVISITGPRQSGKTTLLKKAFPAYNYFNLERPDIRQMAMADPIGFLKEAGERVILDEVQNVPELFSYIQVLSDERGSTGQFVLSGSQSFLLNEKISQSLAGRVNVNHLFPFDVSELKGFDLTPEKLIYQGFYPRLYSQNIDAKDFYPSYLQTYIERDIRTLKNISDLNLFSRFISLCAGRIGQILNITSLANDTGITVNTAKSWLSLLESSFIIFLLQPYYRNFNKRLIKSPKLYFYDTGVASSLLKLNTHEMVSSHYLYGSLFENLVISELLKGAYHRGKKPSLYFWRESNGMEIDCILERAPDKIAAIEIKGGQTFTEGFLKNLNNFLKNKGETQVEKWLIYAGEYSSVVKETTVVSWKDFCMKFKGQLMMEED